jgi:hypothetical protein
MKTSHVVSRCLTPGETSLSPPALLGGRVRRQRHEMRREEEKIVATKVIRTRRLADGRVAKLTRCTCCSRRTWTLGAEPSGCPCAYERGGR